MKRYCVNTEAQANGDHEVHSEDCNRLPIPENRLDLGVFSNCREAVNKAKLTYPKADGCFYCSKECHKR